VWLRKHGGQLITTLAVAVVLGGLTGSTVLLLSLVAVALREGSNPPSKSSR